MGAAHTQTWSTTGQSEVFGDLQDLKLQTKLELSQPQQEIFPGYHPSGWYCLPPHISSLLSGLWFNLLL